MNFSNLANDPMLIPHLPFIENLIPLKGTYRCVGRRLHRRVMAGVWYHVKSFDSERAARKMAENLNQVECVHFQDL